LSVDEEIDYLQAWWGRIAATPETIPVPDWHRAVHDKRLNDLEGNLSGGDSWDALQERLRERYSSH
jgi:putative addiction module component (TIGR02574 family)